MTVAIPGPDLPPRSVGWGQIEAAGEALAAVLRADESGRDWLARFDAAIAGLERALIEHQRLSEEEGGSLDDIAGRLPALVPRLDEQRSDHADLTRRAGRLRSVIEKACAFETYDDERLRLEGRILRDLVQLHLMLETELLEEAYLVEEGGEEG